jgi:glycosyltransferase involved in cell wall biosynthesis
MSAVPVSVLVLTLNEEVNLPDCLASVAWADQVLVVDSFSTDATVAIARAHGADVVEHAFENYSRQRNWALDTLPLRHDWVLFLDADERVTPELGAEIAAVVRGASEDGPRGYYLNRRLIFLGTWIRHAGWYPSWNLRLFRHRFGRYEDRAVHEHVVLRGRAGYLRHDLIHADGRGLEAFIDRHNRYSTLEARARLQAARGRSDGGRLAGRWLGSPVERKRLLRERVWPKVPAKPLALFVYMYVLRRGFLDGRAGLAFCVLQAYQEFTVGLKLAELERASRPPVTPV